MLVVVSVGLLLVGSAGAAVAVSANGAEGNIRVDFVHDSITLVARDVPLGVVLEAIAARSGLVVELDVGIEGKLEEVVALTLTDVPLAEALSRILRGWSFVLRRSERPIRLWVLSGGSQSHASRPEPAPGRLELALSSGDAKARLEAVSELTEKGAAGAAAGDGTAGTLERLVAVAQFDDALSVREEAIYGLGEIGDASALPALEQALADRSVRMREAAIDAIADIGGESSAWALAVALEDQDPELREQAVHALGGIGGDAAITLLERALLDDSASVREAVVEALADLVH